MNMCPLIRNYKIVSTKEILKNEIGHLVMEGLVFLEKISKELKWNHQIWLRSN